MRSLAFLVSALVVVLFAVPAPSQKPDVAGTPPLAPADEKKTFKLPPGFEAQLVAAEPDIQKPINIAFDDQGRLWVTDTREYPRPAKPGTKPRDTLKILEDFGPDGRARKITTFADGLNIPIGVLPLPGAHPRDALVYSIPNIWRMRDSMGKGVADKRDVLYATYGFADTHGMTGSFTHGFDGWIYACHGYANTSTIKGADGRPVTMNSGNTYRFRADGQHIEQFTWGQVNPFGMCLDPWGNLYTADCHSQPIYQLLRGGYYSSFSKGHDGLGFAPEMYTGYKGSTAIAGIAYYAADAFPERYRKSAFIGDVMTNQIVEFALTWHGSTPRAKDSVFLDSTDLWFRPVDVKLGPDGALYVADFYNRIIGHYEVPLNHPGRDRHRGRIWRIVYTGKDNKGTPAPRQDWTKASIDELVADLHHPNLTVRLLATQQLAHRGGKQVSDAALAAFRDKSPLSHKAESDSHALWVLERLGALDDDTLKSACGHADALIRNHAQRILADRKTLTAGQHSLILAGLSDESAPVQRAAADALGQHPDPANLRPLLDLRHRVPAADTHLLHVVRMALRNQLRPAENWKKVAAGTWSKRDEQDLADVALGVHSAEAAHYLLGHVKATRQPPEALTSFVHHIARHATAGDVAAAIAFCRDSEPRNLLRQAALVRAVQRGTQERNAALPADARAWAVTTVEALLAAKDQGQVQQGIELTGVLRLESQQERLIGLAVGKTAAPVRIAALNALAAIDARKHAATLGKVVAEPMTPLEARQHAAGLLARANQPETRAQLVIALALVPARLQTSIAEGLASSREGGEKLLELVASGKASARLLQERSVTVRLEVNRLSRLKERLEKLTAGLPAADAKLLQLIAERRKGYLKVRGDAAKGAAIYEKSCAICHQIGGKGAKIGPQLDGIGLRGLDRLLEDTLDPNRNVDQAFRMTSLTLKKGQLVQGLLLRQEGAVLIVADQEGKEVRVPEKDVEERTVSQMSPMPADVVVKMPDADFYNLMAYLLAQIPAKP